MDTSLTGIHERFMRLRARNAERDNRMAQVKAIREGKMSQVAPDLFPVTGPWQEPIVANMIDVAARDMAEMIAPLPSFNCTNPTMTSDRSKAKATLKTKIANGYAANCDLQGQMYTGCDRYVTYAFLPGRVEIDFDTQMPMIRLLDPEGCYYDKDRFGRLTAFFQHVVVPKSELAALYPEMSGKIRDTGLSGDADVVFYHDKHEDVAYWHHAPTGNQFVLDRTPNPLGKVMVRIAERPGATTTPRGQFDDVLFVQLAKSRMALLALQAASDSVNAPLVVPNDVADVPLGPGATIRTSNPQAVRRAGLDLPPGAFTEQAHLERELQMGARFPQVRTGEVDGSTVTGRGVQALQGGYDSQIRTHQSVFARFLSELMSVAFEADQALFPQVTKNMRGSMNGTPYEVTYTPAKAIEGDYTVDVTYGLMAGLDPNRWLVFALQARSEKMFSRDFMRREMPVDIDVEQESRKIDIEDLEEAAKLAIMGYAQAIPALASQGQDPSGPLNALALVIEGRRKGRPLADVVVEAFTPKPPPEQAQQLTPEDMAAMAAEGGAPQPGQPGPGGPGDGSTGGINVSGNMPHVAPGQQGQPAGGMPDLRTMLASFGSRGGAEGQPTLSAGVKRQDAF